MVPEGTAIVYTGSSAHGQGHDTSFAMLVSDETGIPLDDIRVIHGDTDLVPEGTGTFGSRSLQVGGMAVLQATRALVEKARGRAADLLETERDDVVLDAATGRFHAGGGSDDYRSWSDVAKAVDEPLAEKTTYETTGPTFPFGSHVAVVEVDTDTGRVELRRLIACDDAGRIVNPVTAEGQRHGGIAQGVAQALLEEIRYDEDGNPTTSNLADYGMISATELPMFELVPMETDTPVNDLSVKGIGESGTIGATPAVQNAVIDAVAHLGVRHIDMPLTPSRVWDALQHAREAR